MIVWMQETDRKRSSSLHAVVVTAFVGTLRWKWDIIPVVLGSGLLGLIINSGCNHGSMSRRFLIWRLAACSRRATGTWLQDFSQKLLLSAKRRCNLR
jgi:hypothetical protein